MDPETSPSPEVSEGVEATPESTGAEQEVSTTVDETPETSETPAGEETPKGAEGDSKDDASEQDSVDGLSEELYFNGQQIQVEVPEDIQSNLEEAGVNVNQVINELYSKDGDFTLSEETRAPLDAKYGKGIVDTYLNALKTQNETVLKNLEDDKASAEEADRQAIEWSNEMVGGEENWNALEEWAANNLEDSQVDSFNKAMDTGDPWIQEMAIHKLANQMNEAEGDTAVTLISGDANSNADSGPLSAQDYISAMTGKDFTSLRGDERAAAQSKLDARRRAGMQRGM